MKDQEENQVPKQPQHSRTCPATGDDIIPPPERKELSYFDKLIRYIPGELVAAYLTLDGILKQQLLEVDSRVYIGLYWLVFLSLLILTPLYVKYRPTHEEFADHSRRFHMCAAAVAFFVWVFALGGPFTVTWPELYQPLYGSILLVLTTITIPVFEKIATKLRFFH